MYKYCANPVQLDPLACRVDVIVYIRAMVRLCSAEGIVICVEVEVHICAYKYTPGQLVGSYSE